MPEKEEILKTRVSRKTYILFYLMIAVLAGLAVFTAVSGRELNSLVLWAIVIFSLVGILFTETHRLENLYEINDQSVIHVKGIFFKNTKRTDLLAVSDAELKQGPWQTLLNFGDVDVAVFSRESTTAVRNINNPMAFINFLERKMTEKRN